MAKKQKARVVMVYDVACEDLAQEKEIADADLEDFLEGQSMGEPAEYCIFWPDGTVTGSQQLIRATRPPCAHTHRRDDGSCLDCETT